MVNNLEFGAFWDGDNLDKESNTKNSSDNKGIDDSPDNKGINDPEFGAYGYDNSYTEPKIEDNSEKKSNSRDFPENKGINDPEFGAYGYDDSYTISRTEDNSDRESNTEDSSVNKESNIKDSSTNTGVNNPKTHTAPNKKGELTKTLTKESDSNILASANCRITGADVKRRLTGDIEELVVESRIKGRGLRGSSGEKLRERRDERRGEVLCRIVRVLRQFGCFGDGKDIRLVWHELAEGTKNPMFTIGQGIREMGENNIVCHKMKYPYAVYLCHSIEKTEVYKVPLVSDDGTKVNAMAACHKDTSAWSPNHVAFKVLKVKPGTVPICHFLGRDTLVWIPN
ncbi:hypothetical protein V6N13_030970 [Hibiscus sabdariffa]